MTPTLDMLLAEVRARGLYIHSLHHTVPPGLNSLPPDGWQAILSTVDKRRPVGWGQKPTPEAALREALDSAAHYAEAPLPLGKTQVQPADSLDDLL